MNDNIAASEARTDTKFAQLIGRIDVMRAEIVGRMDATNARLDGMDKRLEAVERDAAGMKFWVIGTGLAVLGLVVAVMAYGDQLFGLGFSAGEIAEQAARRAIEDMRSSVGQGPPGR